MRAQTFALIALGIVCLGTRADQPVLAAPRFAGRQPSLAAPMPDPTQGLVYSCPMDPDVHARTAGVCRRCGMTLVAGVPAPVEFHVDLSLKPPAPLPGQQAVVQFLVHDPWKNRPVTEFNEVHEKLFHAFVVSEDLQFFQHGHPTLVGPGVFQYPIVFPKAGMFRLLGDFYPVGATPQLSSQTVLVAGTPPAPVQLTRDYAPKHDANVAASLITIPEQPIAGNRTQLRFDVTATQGLQKYLGAWAHLLAASNDLIDMMHEHPYRADGGPEVEFEIVFPRPGVYRVWVQFQSGGIVNTVHYDVPALAQ